MFINYICVQALTLTILTCFEGTILHSKQRIDFLFLFDEVHWKYFLILVCSVHAKLIWFLQQYLDNILIISDDQDCKTWCISDTRAGYFLSNFTFRLTGHIICFSVIYVTGQDEFDSRKDTVSAHLKSGKELLRMNAQGHASVFNYYIWRQTFMQVV